MSVLIDKVHYKDLLALNSNDVCTRTNSSFMNKCYNIQIWDYKFKIYPETEEAECINGNPHSYFYLFAIQYLLTAKNMEPSGEWISEKDIPGGATFFRGPHVIPTNLISDKFRGGLEKFEQNCIDLKGIKSEMGDSSFIFEITPNIPVAVVYWMPDEEFPAEAKILYDRTIFSHITTDIVFALASGICMRIAGVD